MQVQAEPIRSHFDTTLGSIFFNVPESGFPEVMELLTSARKLRKKSSEKREEFIDLLMGWVRVEHYSLVAHERAHSIQALTHPALYLRCLREFSAISTIIYELRHAPQALPLPLALAETWGVDLNWPTYPLRLAIAEDGSVEVIEVGDKPRPGDLSETDLLEDSASIFQYRAEIGSESSVGGYRRWLDEGRKYLYAKTFNYVSTLLTPADAYTAIPPLVMAAYETTWPLQGFASLLEMTLREAPAAPSEMGTDEYWRFLQEMLGRSLEVGATPDPRRHLGEEREQRRIDRGSVAALVEEWPLHPLSPIVALAWNDTEALGRLRDAMLHPYRAFSRRERRAEDWLEPFSPPAIGFRMLGDAMGVGDTPLAISSVLIESGQPPAGESWPEYLLELMRLKAFVFAVATPFLRSLPHNCPHTDCKYHHLDMCHGWIHIPEQADACDFPEWLSRSAERRFDFRSNELVPID